MENDDKYVADFDVEEMVTTVFPAGGSDVAVGIGCMVVRAVIIVATMNRH